MTEKGCDNCYYTYFDERAYPCSLCIRGIERTDQWQPSRKTKADRKTESDSEKPNNCEVKICDTCRYYNSNIPCGSTPSACKEADKFAEEFVDGLKKLKPKDEPQMGDAKPIPLSKRVTHIKDEPQTDCPKSCPTINICTKDDTDCPWK